MGHRIVLTPPVVKPSSDEVPALRCFLEFADIGDDLVGKTARLLVYDKALYSQSDLGLSEGPGLKRFVEDAEPLSGEALPGNQGSQLDPALGGGSPVLLKVDGKIAKTKGGHWTLGISRKEENSGPLAESVALHLLQDDDRMLAVAKAGYRAAQPVSSDVRFLLFRIALLEPMGNLPVGKVIASNLNPTHNPGAFPVTLLLAPTSPSSVRGIGLAAAQPAASAVATKQISASSSLRDAAPSPGSRVFLPDMTGLYEQVVTDEDQDPGLMLQLHQAGHSVVGWFTPPFNLPRASPDAKAGFNPAPLPQGCVAVKGNGLVQPGWLTVSLPTNEAGEMIGVCKPIDFPPTGEPGEDPVLDDTSTSIEQAFVRIVPGQAANDPMLLVEVRLGAAQKTPMSFIRYKPYSRWSATTLGEFSPEIRKALVAEEVRPIPDSYFTRVCVKPLLRRSANDQDEGNSPTIAGRIAKWKAGNKIERTLARENISNILRGIIEVAPQGPYRDQILGRLRAAIRENNVTVDAVTQPMRAWMDLMVADRLADLSGLGSSTLTAEQRYQLVETGFRQLDIVPKGEGNIIYNLDFVQVGVGVFFTIGAGAVAFLLTVKAEEIGKDDKRTLLFQQKYRGGFFDVGVGLGFSAGTLQGTGDSALPGSCEIRSFSRLDPQDFNNASIRVTAVKGPSGNLPLGLGGVSGPSSSLIQLHLPIKGVDLETVKESLAKVDSPFDMKKLNVKIKKTGPDFSLKLSAKVFSMSTGFGIILFENSAKLAQPALERPAVVTKTRREVKRTLNAFFAQDSFVIDSQQLDRLETTLAIERKLFDLAGGKAAGFGFTSPEASEDHNQTLSERRAARVRQAVVDAFGDALQIKTSDFDAQGLGELPSRAPTADGGGGLLNPPPPEKLKDLSPELRKRIDQEARTEWPKWRRVDLVAQGSLLVARIKAD